MRLDELVAELAKVNSHIEITGLTVDSREVKPGFVFIALAGAMQHGLKHAQQAIDKGACVVIYDAAEQMGMNEINKDVEWIAIADLNFRLADIAARYYDYPSQNLAVIGITGTNGKTSCSQFLAQVLTDSMVIGTLGWGTWGNLKNTGYTTPNAVVLQSILAETLASGKKTVVMEVSSHGVQEKRIEYTLFKGAVFTNLSRDHLDYHDTMENYFNAKLELFKRPELKFAVINSDDEYGQKIISEISASVTLWTFSKQNQTNSARCVQAKNIDCSIDGIRFEVRCNNEVAEVNSRLYGEFNIENMLAVLTTLLALGLSLSEAAQKVSALQSVSGRMEYFGGGGKPAVFVDYAHTPDALEKVLHGLKEHATEQLTVVFGCGGNRDSGKRPLMGEIATRLADNIIITDDNPRFEEGDTIVTDILSGCKTDKVTVIRDRALAIQTAILQAASEGCVVIAGKGHEDYQEIKGIKMPFSDQVIVKQALENWSDSCT
jgi:UDP-N-acetylmuramoyl-L-alanyl-D-glutamate--2,6-diaminopimelate ligase